MNVSQVFAVIESKWLDAIRETYELSQIQECYSGFIKDTSLLNKDTKSNFSMTSKVKEALHHQRQGIKSGEIKEVTVVASEPKVETAPRPWKPKSYPVLMTRIGSSGSQAIANDELRYDHLKEDGWVYDMEGTVACLKMKVH